RTRHRRLPAAVADRSERPARPDHGHSAGPVPGLHDRARLLSGHGQITRRNTMRTILGRSVIIAALALASAACATSEEWADWKGHTSHFASGDHGFFSIRNREGSATKVTRQDVGSARDQGWWGKAITVSQSAILEN